VMSRIDAGTDEVAAFEELVGCHGGLGGDQTEAVLVYPAAWRVHERPISGPDAVYRQLVSWLDMLGLRRKPQSEPDPDPEPAPGSGPLAPAPDLAADERDQQDQDDHRHDRLPRLGEDSPPGEADRRVHR